jgi:hypothetical protein
LSQVHPVSSTSKTKTFCLASVSAVSADAMRPSQGCRRPGTGAAATRPERGVPGRRRRGNNRGHPGARTSRSPSLPRRGRPPHGSAQEAFDPGASLARPASGPVHRAGAATGRRVGGPVPRRAAARPSARRGTRPGRAGSVPAAGAGSRHAPRRAGRRGVSSCRRSAGPAR